MLSAPEDHMLYHLPYLFEYALNLELAPTFNKRPS